LQDFRELRDLVDLRSREKASHSGQARILADREGRTRRPVVHLPELEHLELAASGSDAPAVKDRAAAIGFDSEGDDENERREDDE
jgi:hypothetical protein